MTHLVYFHLKWKPEFLVAHRARIHLLLVTAVVFRELFPIEKLSRTHVAYVRVVVSVHLLCIPVLSPVTMLVLGGLFLYGVM